MALEGREELKVSKNIFHPYETQLRLCLGHCSDNKHDTEVKYVPSHTSEIAVHQFWRGKNETDLKSTIHAIRISTSTLHPTYLIITPSTPLHSNPTRSSHPAPQRRENTRARTSTPFLSNDLDRASPGTEISKGYFRRARKIGARKIAVMRAYRLILTPGVSVWLRRRLAAIGLYSVARSPRRWTFFFRRVIEMRTRMAMLTCHDCLRVPLYFGGRIFLFCRRWLHFRAAFIHRACWACVSNDPPREVFVVLFFARV